MKQEIVNHLLECLERQTSYLVSNEQVSARQRQHIEEVSQKLGLDGLLAHSSVTQLMEYYCCFYNGVGCVPEHCEMELRLMEQSAKDASTEELCKQYETRNQQYQQIASALQAKEKGADSALSQLKEKHNKQRQRLDKFELDSSAFVRNQNQKLESQLSMCSNSREADPELTKEYEDILKETDCLVRQYCGEHPFPETKTQAIELLNILDSQIQSAQIRLLSSTK